MSGRFERDRRGQLAIMDALVFLLAAMAVSGLIMTYGAPANDQSKSFDGSANPNEILEVYLRASVGVVLELRLDRPVVIDRSQSVGDCLAFELMALKSGTAAGGFSELNSILETMLLSICSPAFEPHLVLYELKDAGWEIVLTLLGAPQPTQDAYASSAEFSIDDDARFLAELVLCPPSSPELVDV